tara:strand:+ start:22 stop:216 length:195 start_codon:yes stop_codon:yes gene_type:complete
MLNEELHEALVVIYKGQSNLAVMAKELNIPLETLQAKFREYVKSTPIDPDVWKGDVEMAWPFIT